MGLAAKAKNNKEGWGMGFLFVFLPEDDKNHHNHPFSSTTPPSSSSSPPPFKQPITALLRRTNSYHLLSTAQSTISICALLFFITLLLFTLSTFEPNSSNQNRNLLPRRQLLSKKTNPLFSFRNQESSHALQGMGNLYRRGTKAMNDLIVAHIVENLTIHELRMFLRLLHRSGLTSKSDVLFITSSSTKSFFLGNTILEENDSFLKLIELYSTEAKNGTELTRSASFDVTQFVKSSKKEKESKEPIWGRKIKSNYSMGNETESTRTSYGSVVSFDVDELDPENSLAGFLDHVPMSLRRWACYPMLLGRVRRNFKHIMLVDAKEILLLGDPLARVRNRSPESVLLSTTTQTSSGKHSRKNSEKTQSTQQKHVINPALVMGGARGVRRFSNAMLTEIVRAAMQQQHKKKNSVTESGLINQLVGNENLLKDVNLVTASESLPELSSLTELKPISHSPSKLTVVRRGNSNNSGIDSSLTKHICSSSLDFKVYSDC